MQKSEEQKHTVDKHMNQDKVLKESLDLYNGASLEFLDSELSGEVTDILNTEFTETTTKKSIADKAFKVFNKGVFEGIHKEWEVQISNDDIKRFASSNIDLSRMHRLDFTTVIITAKTPTITSYKNKSISFTPIIIDLSQREADTALAEIETKINEFIQNEINPLILVYLPLYGSKSGKTKSDLFGTAIKLTTQVTDEKNKQKKLQDLLILLTSSFIDENEFNKILEDNMRILEDNPAVRVLERRGEMRGEIRGEMRGKEDMARNMLFHGVDVAKVSQITGFEMSKIVELQTELQAKAS